MKADLMRTGLILFCALFASAAEAAVIVSDKPTQNMNCSAGVCTPTAKKAILNATDLANILASGDVTVNTAGSLAKDIEINAALSWTSTHRLTLDAYHSITFNKPVELVGTGGLTITTNDGGSGGDYRFFGKGHVKFWDTTSQLEINRASYVLVSRIRDLKKAIKANDSGHYALAKSINARHVFSHSPINRTFYGVFEGLGNTISNLTIIGEGALFTRLCDYYFCSSVIRDLGLTAVNVDGGGYTAALVLANVGLIENCFATGRVSVSGQSGVFAGGLVNDNAGIVENSYAVVAVSGGTAGGLAAINNSFCGDGSCPQPGLIIGSYSLGPVSGSYAGGLVGADYDAQISNSYSFGQVNGSIAGGLVGLYSGNYDAYLLTNSYSTGTATGGVFAGGFVGEDEVQANITNTYWNLDTSGISDPSQGAGNIPNDPGITGLTDAQLKSGLPAGFDPKIWAQSPSINNGYPYLIANPPPP